jgi:hypothetical protein
MLRWEENVVRKKEASNALMSRRDYICWVSFSKILIGQQGLKNIKL